MSKQVSDDGSTEVKVYYPMDSQLQEKADKFACGNSRKKYVTLENNPFGMIAGVFFTGAGVREAMSKTKVNFMFMNGEGKVGSNKWRKLRGYIRIISHAIAYDTIVSAKGKLKGDELFTTQYDVETNDVSFDDFFFDEKKQQIYRYEIK